MESLKVKNEMEHITPKILTNCDFLVPVDRICFGNKNIDPELCQTCQIYAEKKTKPFLLEKGRVFVSKRVSVIHQPCGVTVEAIRA